MGEVQGLDKEKLTLWTSLWLEIQFFYNILTPNTKMIIDVADGGTLMGKECDEAYELLEEKASNSYQCQSERVTNVNQRG